MWIAIGIFLVVVVVICMAISDMQPHFGPYDLNQDLHEANFPITDTLPSIDLDEIADDLEALGMTLVSSKKD